MSTIHDLLAYRRERLPFAKFIPVALALGATALIGGPASITSWLIASGAALLLITQFRLWDDLADRNVDRRLHPERILSSSSNVRSFRLAVVLIGAVNALILASRSDGAMRLLLFAALCTCFGLWYGLYRRGTAASATVAEAHVVLLKYPLIVHLAGPSVSDAWMSRLIAMLVIFVAISAYEILHDSSHRARAYARQIVALDAVVFTSIVIGLAVASLSPQIAKVAGGLSR